jgi:flagellar biosynthesis chaperone FliJ
MAGPITAGDQLRGIDPARMEHIIVTSFLNARRLGKLLEELEPSMDQLKLESTKLAELLTLLEVKPGTYAEIGDSVSRARQSFAELQETLSADELPSLELMQRSSRRLVVLVRAEVAELTQQIDLLNQRIQEVRDRLPDDFTAKFDRVSADAKRNLATLEGSIAKLEDLAERVAGGQGTVGALMNDPEFSDDAKQLGRYLKRHPWKIIKRPPK